MRCTRTLSSPATPVRPSGADISPAADFVLFVHNTDYINFSKRVQIAAIMKTILEQQGAEYALQPIETIQVPILIIPLRSSFHNLIPMGKQEWLLAQLELHGSTSEDTLFNTSLATEPRDG